MISKDKLKAIRASIDAALAQVAREHGLSALKAGNCTYDTQGSFTFKVDGTEAGGLTKEQQVYRDAMTLHDGLPELGAKLTINRRQVKIVGANSTCTKVQAKCIESGVVYLYRVADIVRVAKAQKAAA